MRRTGQLLPNAGEETHARSAILQDLCPLQGHESAFHHLIKHRQELVDPVFTVHNFNHCRQILRNRKYMAAMHTARLAETDWSTQHASIFS